MLPVVTTNPLSALFAVNVRSIGVSVSVCWKPVVWLLNCHVILGTGAPTDLQEMLVPPPSGITTAESLRAVVLASTVFTYTCICS